MSLEKYSTEIFKILNSDETLLRLLYYKPTSRTDDPLDKSKPDILLKDIEEKWIIIDDCIVNAPKVSDIEGKEKSRLFYYAGYGASTNSNYLFSKQEYCFDVLTHSSFQQKDRRNEKICDRINQIIFQKKISGLGELLFKNRRPIKAPKDYLGYQLIYEIISENY